MKLLPFVAFIGTCHGASGVICDESAVSGMKRYLSDVQENFDRATKCSTRRLLSSS